MTSSEESLEHTLPRSDLIEIHSHLADGLLSWVIMLLAAATGVFLSHRATSRPGLWTFPRLLVGPRRAVGDGRCRRLVGRDGPDQSQRGDRRLVRRLLRPVARWGILNGCTVPERSS